jgi:hypothetical protein
MQTRTEREALALLSHIKRLKIAHTQKVLQDLDRRIQAARARTQPRNT